MDSESGQLHQINRKVGELDKEVAVLKTEVKGVHTEIKTIKDDIKVAAVLAHENKEALIGLKSMGRGAWFTLIGAQIIVGMLVYFHG